MSLIDRLVEVSGGEFRQCIVQGEDERGKTEEMHGEIYAINGKFFSEPDETHLLEADHSVRSSFYEEDVEGCLIHRNFLAVTDDGNNILYWEFDHEGDYP